jgi:hypothetical protein
VNEAFSSKVKLPALLRGAFWHVLVKFLSVLSSALSGLGPLYMGCDKSKCQNLNAKSNPNAQYPKSSNLSFDISYGISLNGAVFITPSCRFVNRFYI